VARGHHILERLAIFQTADPFLAAVRRFLNNGTLPQEVDLRDIVIKTGDLFHIRDSDNTLWRECQGQILLCAPKELQPIILYDAHNIATAGHRGSMKLALDVKRNFWWPTLDRDVRQYTQNCAECLAHKPPPRIPRQPLGERPPPNRVWERLHLDVWTPRGNAQSGNACVIAFIDAFSKYLIAVAAPDHQALTVIDVFTQHVAIPYGLPEHLISDGAPEFTGHQLSQYCSIFGITKHVVVPYRPQSNGLIERVFRTIRPMLAAVAHRYPAKWDEYLPYTVHAYNITVHEAIQQTPFFLMFGRDPSPLLYSLEREQNATETSTTERLQALKNARRIVTQRLIERQRTAKNRYDRRVRIQHFAENDVVLLRCQQIPANVVRKIHPLYVGPYRVVAIQGQVLSVRPLQTPDVPPKRIHMDRARPCSENYSLPLDAAQLLLPFTDPAAVCPGMELESA